MTNLLYRTTSTPTVPASSSAKGSALTNLEIDANFKSISDDVATKSPIASPTFTGTPAAPTAAAASNTTQVATTAHVFGERSNTATLTNKTLTQASITNPINTEVTLTDAVNTTWDMDTGHVAKWTITATGRAFATPTNQKVGGQYVLFVTLVTPSTMTPTWPASILWPYGTAPDLTTSATTIISLVWSSVHLKFLASYTPGYV